MSYLEQIKDCTKEQVMAQDSFFWPRDYITYGTDLGNHDEETLIYVIEHLGKYYFNLYLDYKVLGNEKLFIHSFLYNDPQFLAKPFEDLHMNPAFMKRLCTALCEVKELPTYTHADFSFWSLSQQIGYITENFSDLISEENKVGIELYFTYGEPIIKQYVLQGHKHLIRDLSIKEVDELIEMQIINLKNESNPFINDENHLAYQLIKEHGIEAQVKHFEALLSQPQKPKTTILKI